MQRSASLTIMGIVIAALCSTLLLVRSHPVSAVGRGIWGLPPGVALRATELRLELGRVLGEHAFLTAQAMRSGIAGGDDFAAAAEALESNTRDLQRLMASVYGEEAAARIGELWRGHIGYIVDYTVALAANDLDAADTAVRGLESYQTRFVELLTAANPFLTQEAIGPLITEHVSQLTQLAAVIEQDYGAAYRLTRAAYGHMFTLAESLAAAIARQFPDSFPGPRVAASAAVDLRVDLDRLLGEHTFLSVDAMRAAVSGTADAAAAHAAVDANTAELGAAFTSIYGERAGTEFRSVWDEHIDAYFIYIDAIARDDEEAAESARNILDGYAVGFSAFLGVANPELPQQQVKELVAEHAHHLVSQVDAFAAGRFSEAYTITRDAFAHSLLMSDALATAIAAQQPDVFPPLPATATATPPPPPPPIPALILLTVFLAVTALSHHKRWVAR
jgi:hypothetical protein